MCTHDLWRFQSSSFENITWPSLGRQNIQVKLTYRIPNYDFCFLVHRQPKRTMCGFGLQRSFGRNILELLVYYLMPNKCKNLKDMKSSTFALSQTGTVDRAKLTTLPRESDVLSIWRGRQAPRFKSRRITVRLRIMAKRSWPESMRNAALLGLMQPNLETGARRTGRFLYTLRSGWWQF